MSECTSCNLYVALQRFLLGMGSRCCFPMRQCVQSLCGVFTVGSPSTIPPYARVLSPL
ncbi:hypothetical protein Lalb_Chr06g0166081 [Lupinus albus]|uniref:Uncharacterized protein n=1 Tax=Lupinus albus TaxID=3870 RepID=A0A6A4QD91_LUPAL|nr:hypothetical protein Lalb_Chr06g0166081 [Lupinus albus]